MGGKGLNRLSFLAPSVLRWMAHPLLIALPMLSRVLLLAALLGLGSAAHAASSLESVRAQAAEARQKVLSVRSEQLGLRQRLNQVATRIEALKSGEGGGLGKAAELDAALKESQSLSGALTGLAQSLSGAESAAESVNLTLLQEIGREMDRVFGMLERTGDRERRRALISQLRRLRAERDGIRARLPATKVPALSSSHSDDPEDLIEQADALRDSQDKVSQRLASLRGRMQELRAERELDERMNEFMGDDGLFDEQDRRLRLSRETRTEVTLGAPPAGGAGIEAGDPSEPSVGSGTPQSDMTSSPPPPETAERGTGTPATSPGESIVHVQTFRAADNQPNIGRVHGRPLASGSLVEMDLEQLAAEEERLERLAEELGGRATKLEKRARELD